MENKKFDVSVILPVNTSTTKDFEDLFIKSIKSVENQITSVNELIIVHSSEETLMSYLNSYDFNGLNVKLIENKGLIDFASQINLGVKESNSEWVSILEFDDEYSSIWFKNVDRYVNCYGNEVDAYLPLVIDIDNKGVFAGFTNEATFAVSINTEMGVLTNDLLMTYQNFQSSGMVIRKKSFIENGGIKPSMKLTFVYEFLLRLTYNSTKIMTIPKIGYKHMNMREGSIFWNYKFGEPSLTENEIKFWLDSAKKEYFFNVDREIKYVSETI
jgi:hypothetical protein